MAAHEFFSVVSADFLPRGYAPLDPRSRRRPTCVACSPTGLLRLGGPDQIRTGDLVLDRDACLAATPRDLERHHCTRLERPITLKRHTLAAYASGGPGARSPWGESPQTFDYRKKLVSRHRAPQTFDYRKKLVYPPNV